MGVFEDYSVLLELKDLPFKERNKVKSAVTENGGRICFVINKQCSLVVTSNMSNLSSYRLRSIQKFQTPVVGIDYVQSCLERGAVLPVDGFKMEQEPPLPVALKAHERAPPNFKEVETPPPPKEGSTQKRFRIYEESDGDFPEFPENFQVAMYSIFEQVSTSSWCMLELQSVRTKHGQRYRVATYWKDNLGSREAVLKNQLAFASSSEEALDIYEMLSDEMKASGLQIRRSLPAEVPHLGSTPLQQLLLLKKLNCGSLSQDVAVFVEMLWTEALGRLSTVLSVPIQKLSLNDVSRAEGLMLQAQKKLKEGNQNEMMHLLEEFFILLPHKRPHPLPPYARFLSQKLDLCQLIRDVLSVSEMTLQSPKPSCVGKYRALRCSIDTVPRSSMVFQKVASLLEDSPVKIKKIMSVTRGVELQTFNSRLGNIKPLLHSSNPSNFVGILSRGLLLPHAGVEHHGIERTDLGNLGGGIYFSNCMSTSLKYSRPSETDGSRLLLVCDVALGQCMDLYKRDLTLTQAPEGYHSVHGVRSTANTQSDFQDDEYVVYSPDQIQIMYVVQFSVEGDQVKDFSPAVDLSAELSSPVTDEGVELSFDEMENLKNPLEEVTAGLLDSSGQKLPLQAVHVKCKLMDLLSQVIIFQKYTNLSKVPIEAKYVFPLDDSAAVCGFEAFINGKHVVGQVKEKETARQEYRRAIEKGHGAYLMDQDAPDVFTISVGNLPPGSTVLIKVIYVSELVVRDGQILLSLPGSVAPWQESASLNQTTQVSVHKVCVTDGEASQREFTLDVSVEMPHVISSLNCTTHQVKIKRTECKAVVSVLPGQVMGPDGFQLSINLSEVHLPRMWVEKHPEKDSQACMLVFYPDFEFQSGSEADEVILLLDTSESMRGEWLRVAQSIALQVLKKLQSNIRINIILFGTDYSTAFSKALPLSKVHQTAESFIRCCSLIGGSTELWQPLLALSLLPPSRGIRNLLLLSDGHIQNAALVLKLLRENALHSRLFTCGFSPTANCHMLRALAQAGGGAYEFFDRKTKHNWAEKVQKQVKRMSSPGCSSVSVKWQQFNPSAASALQAPKQLHALFSSCHTLVYGFVPHCTQATLLGNLCGQEIQTMVSTTELQKSKGTFLHKLTARALIRDYEDGSLDPDQAEHEGQRAELKSFIINLSKEFSILSQFTSFVAIEERDSEENGVTDIPKLVEEEDVDILPYISWMLPQDVIGQDEVPPSSYIEIGRNCMDEVEDFCFMDEDFLLDEHFESSSSDEISAKSMHPSYEDDEVCSMEIECEPESSKDFETSATRLSCDSDRFIKNRAALPKRALGHLPQEFSYHRTPPAPLLSMPPPAPPTSMPPTHLLGSPAPPPPMLARCDSLAHSQSIPGLLPPLSPKKVRGKVLRRMLHSSESIQSESPPPVVFMTKFALPSQLSSMSPTGCNTSSPSLSPSVPSPSIHMDGAPPHLPSMLPSVLFEAPGQQSSMLPMMLESSHSFVPFGSSLSSMPSTGGHSRPPPLPPSMPFKGGVKNASLFGCNKVQDCSFSVSSMQQDAKKKPKYLFASKPLQNFTFCSDDSVKSLETCRYMPMEDQCLNGRSKRSSTQVDVTSTVNLNLKWAKIFQLQHSVGYWDFTAELGDLINLNADVFVNVFLKNKGICSLGAKAHTDVLRMVATLLVLQLMRLEKRAEGKLLLSLFRLEESSSFRPEFREQVRKAVDWVCWADRQYPCIYSRLEFGLSWESSTRQLLGYDGLPLSSPLIGLNLQKTLALLQVH